MISGKRYNTNHIESEIFILFTGITESFYSIYSLQMNKEFGLNLLYSNWV